MVDGQLEQPPGLTCISWLDNPELRLKLGSDAARRRPNTLVHGIVLHTTKGIPGGPDLRPQEIRAGRGPHVDAGLRCARFWSGSDKMAGAHLVVDFDGVVACCADLRTEAAFHAGAVNQLTIGVEIYQGSSAELYSDQLDAVVVLVDWLTRRFQIQRQIPDRYRGDPLKRIVDSMGAGFWGVYGHRDCDASRGSGDPGSAIFRRLGAAGYEDFDIDAREDVDVWKGRQQRFGLVADGMPGPKTAAALLVAGKPHGLWVPRPGDDAWAPPAVT